MLPSVGATPTGTSAPSAEWSSMSIGDHLANSRCEPEHYHWSCPADGGNPGFANNQRMWSVLSGAHWAGRPHAPPRSARSRPSRSAASRPTTAPTPQADPSNSWQISRRNTRCRSRAVTGAFRRHAELRTRGAARLDATTTTSAKTRGAPAQHHRSWRRRQTAQHTDDDRHEGAGQQRAPQTSTSSREPRAPRAPDGSAARAEDLRACPLQREPPAQDQREATGWPPLETTRRTRTTIRAPSLAVPRRWGKPGLLGITGLLRVPGLPISDLGHTGLLVHPHHHGPHDLVRPGLPLLVPQRRQETDVASKGVERVAQHPQEGVAETDRLTGLLADGLDLDHLLTDRLTGGTPAIRQVPDHEGGIEERTDDVGHHLDEYAGCTTAASATGQENAQESENEHHDGVGDVGQPDIDEIAQEPRAPRGQLTRRVVPRRVSPTSGGTVLRNRLSGLLRQRRRAGLLREPARRLTEGLRPGRRIGTRHECSLFNTNQHNALTDRSGTDRNQRGPAG